MAQRIVSGLLMSLVLSCFMTLWVTWSNMGFIDNFLALWGRAFVMAWPVAATIAILLGPRVQQLTSRILAGKQ